MRRRIRLLRVVGCAVLCVAVVLPPAAVAQPSAEELWDDYPLQQELQSGGVDLAGASPTAGAAATPQFAPAPARPAERGSLWVLLLIAAVLIAASVPLVLPAVRRRRRERRSGATAGSGASTSAVASAGSRLGGSATSPSPSGLLSVSAVIAARAGADAVSGPPSDPRQPWSAEIEWCEAGGEWRFRAIARTPGVQDPSIVAESPPLEWPPSSETAVEELTAAAERLEAVMVATGWTALAPGDAWYAKRFAWEPVAAAQARAVRPRAPARRPHPERASPVPRPGAERGRSESRNGAEPARKLGRFSRSSAWPQGSEAAWRCEIQLETAYGKSRLRAVAFPPRSKMGHTIGTSGRFQWVHGPDEKLAADVETAEALAAGLVRAGWEPTGLGAQWYARRFLWRHEERPADHVEPDRTQFGRAP